MLNSDSHIIIMLYSRISRQITKNLSSASLSRFFSHHDTPVRVNAGKVEEFSEGKMKAVQVGANPENYVLLAEVNSGFYSIGGKCTHYGAPLHQGFLSGYNVACPWHAAEFDVRTGEMVTTPGIQSVPKYKVEVINSDIFIEVPNSHKENVAGFIDSPRMVKRDLANETHFVIIGGGAAGQIAAETLRKEGFSGKITILSKESHLAYDRVSLSKNFDVKPEQIALRPQAFYETYGIDYKRNVEVKMIMPEQKHVLLASGEQIAYDKLLLATGSNARVPQPLQRAVSGIKNVVTIRNTADHAKIKDGLVGAKNIVVIGGSFLGLEAATSLRRKIPDARITIVEFDSKPLERIFGSQIADLLVNTQIASGNRVITGVSARSINQENGKVKSVTVPFLNGEEEIKADLVLVATGAQIVTDYIPSVLLNPQDRSVKVNSHLQTENPDIYAAGDIASFPSELTGSNERVEHWQVAQTQGIRAAANMLGKNVDYRDIPLFWSNQFLNVQFVGFGAGKDSSHSEVAQNQDPLKVGIITYYFKGENCIGAAACNWPGAIIKLRIALAKGFMPSKAQFISGEANFSTISEEAKNNSCSHCEDVIGNDH